jgi:hypothetical protein
MLCVLWRDKTASLTRHGAAEGIKVGFWNKNPLDSSKKNVIENVMEGLKENKYCLPANEIMADYTDDVVDEENRKTPSIMLQRGI